MLRAESGPTLHERLTMPSTEATVRYEPAADLDEETLRALIELLRRAFDGGPSWFRGGVSPLEHLRWKAVERPAGAIVELTELDGALAGMRLESLGKFLVRGRRTLARHGGDAAIDPAYQGKRISSARTRFREGIGELPGVRFAYEVGTHPASPLMRPGASRAIVIANHIDTLSRPLSLRRLLEARRARAQAASSASNSTPPVAPSRGGRLARWARRGDRAMRQVRALTLGGPRARSHPGTIRTMGRFDERVDDLAVEASSAFDLIQIRDARYLNWRFRDERAGRFLVRVLEDGERLLGYSVLRTTPPSGVLADLLVRPGRDDVLRALLSDASLAAATRGLADVRTWLPRHHPYRGALESEGYTAYPNDLRVAIVPSVGDEEIVAIASDPIARLHFTISDTDHV